MREILFRGKRKDNGEWVEGYFCRKYFPELPHDRCVIQYKTECTKEWRPDYMVAEVIPETVGQFTGLTDKNGKKIFEGDIVQEVYDDRRYGCYEVNMNEERCGWFPFACGDCCGCCEDEAATVEDCEVIGNIHDNPELLKEGADND